MVSRFPQYLRESVNVFHGIVLLGWTYLITAMLTGAKVDARYIVSEAMIASNVSD